VIPSGYREVPWAHRLSYQELKGRCDAYLIRANVVLESPKFLGGNEQIIEVLLMGQPVRLTFIQVIALGWVPLEAVEGVPAEEVKVTADYIKESGRIRIVVPTALSGKPIEIVTQEVSE